ncbi:hypothetical protein B296_00011907 [Ensete ventricosum]|uniref:Uncharacterized protein n=1 Tax=Ensete ventricosum TaxID=4639 RepID=A0A427A119_ENSVE|nr:hypothetical protein B296_00011907 [Ensete ventricosum]
MRAAGFRVALCVVISSVPRRRFLFWGREELLIPVSFSPLLRVTAVMLLANGSRCHRLSKRMGNCRFV